MIGPGNSGGEGFARHLNRKEWQRENCEPNDICKPLPVALPTTAGVLVGILIACSAVAGIQT
jgi:hypothetical protein